jgi:hypothetical protein
MTNQDGKRMMLVKAGMATLAALGLCAATAQADHYNWTGNGDGISWEDLANWDAPHGDEGLPGPANITFINGTANVELSSTQSIRTFAIGQGGGVATLNILPGANLTVAQTARLSRDVAAVAGDTTGRIIQTGGSLTMLGTSQLRMSFDGGVPPGQSTSHTADSYYGISGGSFLIQGDGIVQLGRETQTYNSSIFEVIGSGATQIETWRFYTRVNALSPLYSPTGAQAVPTVSFALDSGGVTPITVRDVLEIRDAPAILSLSLLDADVPEQVTLFQFGRLRGYDGVQSRFRHADGTLIQNGDDVSVLFGDSLYEWTINYVDVATGDPANGLHLSNLRITSSSIDWNVNSDGDWSDSGNWSGGVVPNGAGVAARLGDVITAPRTVTVDTPVTLGSLTFASAHGYTVAGTEAITLDHSGNVSLVVSSGSHTISAPLVLAQNAAVNVASGAAVTVSDLAAGTVGLTKTGDGTLEVNRVNGNDLAVNAGTVRLSSGGGTSQVASLAVAAGARLDVNDNTIVVQDGDVSAITALVASGSASNWSGPGINSSAAAAESGRALGIGVDGDDVRVQFTWGGDATLDGSVTIADLGVLAANWQAADRFWYHGDFNYDGSVNIADLGILAGNWQKGTSGGGMSFEEALAMFDVFEGVVVPEPAAAGLLGLGALLLGRRRRA